MLRHAVLPCRVSYSAYAGAASTNSVGVWGGCRAGVNWELGVQCACGVVSKRLGAARQAEAAPWPAAAHAVGCCSLPHPSLTSGILCMFHFRGLEVHQDGKSKFQCVELVPSALCIHVDV